MIVISFIIIFTVSLYKLKMNNITLYIILLLFIYYFLFLIPILLFLKEMSLIFQKINLIMKNLLLD